MTTPPDTATCPVCGRPLIRRVTEYRLGRADANPVRWVGKWWHDGSTSEACADPGGVDDADV